LVIYGLFPRVTKHIWSLIALQKISLGREEGQPGEGWINASIKNAGDVLPLTTFSWQGIWVLGVFPALVFLIYVSFTSVSMSFSMTNFNIMYTGLYIGQLFVLHHTAKGRGYFYPPHPDKIIYLRTIVSLFVTIVLPVSFGIICQLWLQYLGLLTNTCCAILGAILLLAVLPFPTCCHQGMLPIVRRYEWAIREEHPEIYTGRNGHWYAFGVYGIICLGALVLVSTFQSDLIFSKPTLDSIMKVVP